jgi:hypothetical protein
MKSVEFCYWLQGFFELSETSEGLIARQADLIKRHLNMVFVHEIDASYPAEQQEKLNGIHSGSFNPLTDPLPSGVPRPRC